MSDISRLFVKDGNLVDNQDKPVEVESMHFEPSTLLASRSFRTSNPDEGQLDTPPKADAYVLSTRNEAVLIDGAGRHGDAVRKVCYAVQYYKRK